MLLLLWGCASSQPEAVAPPLQPEGACAALVEEHPLSLFATRSEVDTLHGLGAGGAQRVLHRAFANEAVRNLAWGKRVALEDQIVGVVTAERACGRGDCEALGEVYWITATGVTTQAFVPVFDAQGGHSPRVTRDGLVGLPVGGESGFAYVSAEEGRVGEFPGWVGPADDAGWRRAEVPSPEGAGETVPGFLRFLDGATETRALGVGAAPLTPTATGWASWDVSGFHIDRAAGRVTLGSVPGLEGARELRPRMVAPRDYELWAGDQLHGYFDGATEEVRFFAAPFSGAPGRLWTAVAHGVLLVHRDGLPLWRMFLATGEEAPVTLPPGFELGATTGRHCPWFPQPTASGGVAMGLRSPERLGAYRVEEGVARPVGRALRGVNRVELETRGEVTIVESTRYDGELWCFNVPDALESPDGAIEGTSSQYLAPDGTPLFRPGERYASLCLNAEGRCLIASQETEDPEERVHVLRDLETGEEARWRGPAVWHPVEPRR